MLAGLTNNSKISVISAQRKHFSFMSQDVEVALLTSVDPRILLPGSYSTFHSPGVHHWTLFIELAEKEGSGDCRKFKGQAQKESVSSPPLFIDQYLMIWPHLYAKRFEYVAQQHAWRRGEYGSLATKCPHSYQSSLKQRAFIGMLLEM